MRDLLGEGEGIVDFGAFVLLPLSPREMSFMDAAATERRIWYDLEHDGIHRSTRLERETVRCLHSLHHVLWYAIHDHRAGSPLSRDLSEIGKAAARRMLERLRRLPEVPLP